MFQFVPDNEEKPYQSHRETDERRHFVDKRYCCLRRPCRQGGGAKAQGALLTGKGSVTITGVKVEGCRASYVEVQVGALLGMAWLAARRRSMTRR